MKSLAQLQRVCAKLPFQAHNIRRFLNERGRYDVDLNREFPLLVSLFSFRSGRFTTGPTWHDRLELFIPIEGTVRFRMGEHTLDLAVGDLLVVDNMQLHEVVDHPGFKAKVIVVSFMPELVYSLGSPPHDYSFLVPFFISREGQPQVLTKKDTEAAAVYASLVTLLERYHRNGKAPYHQAGCKAALVDLLYHLACRFHATEIAHAEFVRQQERAQRFGKLFEYVAEHYAEKISIARAAQLSGVSQSQFMKLFKEVSGTTFVDYLTHVRLSKSHELLRETSFSIAEIATVVGFSDQSYFDRRFKEYFKQTPRDYRRGMRE